MHKVLPTQLWQYAKLDELEVQLFAALAFQEGLRMSELYVQNGANPACAYA